MTTRLLSSRTASFLLPSRPLSTSAPPRALLVRLSSSTPPTPPSPSPYVLPNGLVMTGIVTSAGKMRQTTTVTVEHRKTHHKTLKEFKEHHKFLVHDPDESTVVGDRVQIRNCRPVSKRKRFELVAILQGARERVENMSEGVEVAAEVEAKL